VNDINLRTPLFPHRVLVASAAHSDQFEASETAQILIGVARMGCKPDQVWFSRMQTLSGCKPYQDANLPGCKPDQVWFSRIQDANLIRYGFPGSRMQTWSGMVFQDPGCKPDQVWLSNVRRRRQAVSVSWTPYMSVSWYTDYVAYTRKKVKTRATENHSPRFIRKSNPLWYRVL